MSAYTLAALREHRRQKEAEAGGSAAPLSLADIPADAPMEDGIVLGCWNGEAFVSWEKWLLSQPLESFLGDPAPETGPAESQARGKAKSGRAHSVRMPSLFEEVSRNE